MNGRAARDDGPMPSTSPLEAAIDRLYALPLDRFVPERDELARQHRGDEARAIRALQKPNVIAWSLNQVYWSARPVFDRLVASAARLREAQASGLLGKPGDLRDAGAAHREALLAAVKEAATILGRAGHDAGPDALRSLTAAFEALPWEEPAGRLVRPPTTTGFAVFAGMPATAGPPPVREAPVTTREEEATGPRNKRARGDQARAARDQQERDRERQEREERRAREAIDAARREADTAADRLLAARNRLERARADEEAARTRLDKTRRAVKEAERAVRDAEREVTSAEKVIGQRTADR